MLIVLLFVTYEYLAIGKWLKNKDRHNMEVWKTNSSEDFYLYLETGNRPSSLIPSNDLQFEALEELLEDTRQTLLDRTAKERLFELADQMFRNKYEKTLFHRRWSIRMNTLHLIETFYMRETVDQVLKFYNSRNRSEEERVQALRIMAYFREPSVVTKLLTLEQPLSHSAYFSILKRMDEPTFHELIDHFETFEQAIQLDILDAIRERKATQYSNLLEELLLNQDKEVRIRAMKAILEIETISDPEPLYRLISSENWEERMMVARFFGRFRNDAFMPQLEQLLQDRSWWVRNAAAQSILQYENGQAQLEYIKAHHHDQFAKEMANNWLPKEGVYGH